MTRFPWGKLSGGSYHHLAHHCADVAACFEKISELPVVRARLETTAERTLDDTDIARLALFAFLHDLGKLHPEFQAKANSDRQGWKRGHSGEGLALMFGKINADVLAETISNALSFDQIAGWADNETLCSLAMAIFAHHGRPVTISDTNMAAWSLKPRGLESYDLSVAVNEIGKLLPKWFPQAFSPVVMELPSAPTFQHLFCGLVALADWIGSDLKSCQYSAELDCNYMQKARDHAKASMLRTGLDSTMIRRSMIGADFTDIAPGRTPRKAQAVIGDWPVDDQLIILEAETGSGKTEAALWRFARLFEAHKVDSLYFAVPTRAAAKQLHARVHDAMEALFGDQAPQTVLAIPGYLKAGAFEGQALPDFKVLWDDDNDSHVHRTRWAAENHRRFLAASVAVGTVDQAMLAGLMVKHAHLRGAALSRSLLVIDEVHASDSYMTEVQKNLLDIHLGRGGFAMLMSATLGSAARTRWLGVTDKPALKEAQETVYPAVWGKTTPMKPVDPDGRIKTVKMTSSDDWSAEKCAALAIDAARRNAKVLVIRNTVQAAVDTFDAVRTQNASNLLLRMEKRPALHHSRFAVEDRGRLDDIVEATLSPDPEVRPDHGVIVIGTQTVEQSLDICADYLISDLCPADVLLQRIGRLHRHEIERPAGYETPKCIVLSPSDGLGRFASGSDFEIGLGKMSNGGGVYLNLHACELTRRMVESQDVWIIPEMNRFLVEGATHGDAINLLNDELGKEWQEYWNYHGGDEIAKRQAGNRIRLDVTIPFLQDDPLFPTSEVSIRTRLGAEGVRVKFIEGVVGPFGQPVSEIVCPAYWNVPVSETPVDLRKETDGNFGFEIMSEEGEIRSFRYRIHGLSKK